MKSCLVYVMGLLWLQSIGCSYSFTGSNLGHIESVHVPVFDNLTPEPTIRERLTNELIDAIINDNELEIGDQQGADAYIVGRITDVNDQPFTFQADQDDDSFTTNDYKVTVVTKVRFEDKVEGKLLWEENIVGWGRYTLDGAITRDDGIDAALDMISQNVLNKVLANW